MTGVDQAAVTVDRVGPGGGVASDSAFGVALVSLWQGCAEAGDQVGFSAPVVRSEVAARAAGLLDEIKTGRLIAVAANRARRLVGVAFLRPGRGVSQHTGQVALILVDPGQRRQGLGTRLLRDLLSLAGSAGVQLIEVNVPADAGLQSFLAGFGFTEWGRRRDWIRAGDLDVDEIMLGVSGNVTGPGAVGTGASA